MALKKNLASIIFALGISLFNCNDKINVPLSPVISSTTNNSFDYCRINENSDIIDRQSAGEPHNWETIFESNLERINNLSLSIEQIIHPERAAYEILIVPVGFNQTLNPIMENMRNTLEKAFDGVDVSFSYLDFSVPIGFRHLDRKVILANPEEASILRERINTIYPVNNLAFMLNTDIYLGTYTNYPIFSTGGELDGRINTPHLFIHEIGHNLGLWDGYRRFYHDWEINRSELFTSLEDLDPNILDAYERIRPPIVNTGNTCNGEPIYTFYSDSDIMDRFYNLGELTALFEDGRTPFNPLQIEIMNDYIRRQLTD